MKENELKSLTNPFTNPAQWQHPTTFTDWNRVVDIEFADTDVEIRLVPSGKYIVYDKKAVKAARVINRTDALKLRLFRLEKENNIKK
jgi:hypothetical protein